MRYSVAMFFLAVALTALLISTMLMPNQLSLKIAATFTMLLLLSATISAAAWRKPSRWFWFGYALAGWGYMAIAFLYGGIANDLLLTRYVSTLLDRTLKVSKPKTTPSGELVTLRGDEVRVSRGKTTRKLSRDEAAAKGYAKYTYSDLTLPNVFSFLKICDCMWALILALSGGCLAFRLAKASQDDVMLN
jgi:hypothetical protein